MQRKRVRMLLRVSSNQQLEKDGDLSVQRKILLEYIEKHSDWKLDKKEYFEGSNSGFKNSVDDRDVLQEALDDAKKDEYDILVVYKDDRIGRRMWEIGAYVNELKKCNVDIYTTVDDCISPEADDMMGQLVLAMRYNMAEKSSRDTGVRVRDNAIQFVKSGKFMGGKAPYGYELVYSGELSKHGRALKKPVIVEERIEVIQYIYHLYLFKGFGAVKIAKTLNSDEKYRILAPNKGENWKSGTITSILTNPIYAGYVTYKRREKKQSGQYRRLNSADWIKAEECNPDLVIIDSELWDKAQEERFGRAEYYRLRTNNRTAATIKTSHSSLILLDVIYCGYCGSKLTNASKYNYWTMKDTGEHRKSKTTAYRCIRAWQGEPHEKQKFIHSAGKLDRLVLSAISDYITKVQTEQDAYNIVLQNQQSEKIKLERKIKILQMEKKKLGESVAVIQDKIPDAIQGNYALSVEDLSSAIARLREKTKAKDTEIELEAQALSKANLSLEQWEKIKTKIPSWIEVLEHSDDNAKRQLVNKLIERVEVTADQVVIRFRITLEDFIPKMRQENWQCVSIGQIEINQI